MIFVAMITRNIKHFFKPVGFSLVLSHGKVQSNLCYQKLISMPSLTGRVYHQNKCLNTTTKINNIKSHMTN